MSETLEFEVLTIFPEVIDAFVASGILARAIERRLVAVRCTDLREFTQDRHRTVDDAPFGGGAGMVIKPEPVAAAIEAVVGERGPMHTILLTPSGARFDQRVAERLAGAGRIALLCGRYEGIDDRIREHFVDECLSIGDFVLNGGEVAAAVIIEAVGRLREGVLGNPESIATESFAADPSRAHELGPEPRDSADPASGSTHDIGERIDERGGESRPELWRAGVVLEHPHYTRPAEFRGHAVPAVLLGGDHQAIEAWRRRVACLRTWTLRPELRPRWTLPAEHPIYLALAHDTPAEALADLRALAAELGTPLVLLGGGRSLGTDLHMRDLKQLRKSLRKRHDRDPWVVGVGQVGVGEPEQGPRVVLDTLAFVANQAPPALILWFAGPSGDPSAIAADAWMALDPEQRGCDRRFPRRLAIPSALIDISQPRAAPGPITPLARTAVQAIRAEGLLPAGPGRAPSPDRETSS